MQINIIRPLPVHKTELRRLFTETISKNFKEEGIYKTHHTELKNEIEEQMNTLQKGFDSKGKEEYFLVAQIKNTQQIAGIIAYGKANDIIKQHLKTIDWNNTAIPEIKSVYILPKFQNQGIGSILFNHILHLLHQKQIPEFCLDSGYKRAQVYWTKKLGQATLILNDYWDKNADHKIWLCETREVMNTTL